MKITTNPLVLALIAVAGLNLPLRGQPVQAPMPSGELKPDSTDKFFPEGAYHDFGNVKRGTMLYHTFRIVNNSATPLKITFLHANINSIKAWPDKKVLQPGEEGKIKVAMDTRTFNSFRTCTVIVRVDNGRLSEHRLWVNANSCENLAFISDRLDFGEILRGDTPSKHVIVAVPDQPNLKVTAATCASKFVQIKLQELGRGPTTAIYKLSATLQADIPEGETHETVELTTDNPAMPKLHVPLRVVVEAGK